MTEILKSKINDRNSSVFWPLLFRMLRHLQILVLICLFIKGSAEMNQLRNLGFMIFFAVYTASESLYRHTNKLLIVFNAFFIFGQYYFSLTYFRYV